MTDARLYGPVTASYYDGAYGEGSGLGADVAFYRGLAAETGGPVLELGCGTGRVLLPIAADGHSCVGLDDAGEMLEVLARKSPPVGLRTVRAPMQDFDLGGERFALVFSAFRAFQHLIEVEDQLACLACARRHLGPGGVLAFDLFNPRLARTALREEPEHEDARFAFEGDEVVRFTSVRRDPARQVMDLRMRYERRRGGRLVREDVARFPMRWFFRFEVEHLLARAGFERPTLYGDFDRSPFAADSPALVFVAWAR